MTTSPELAFLRRAVPAHPEVAAFLSHLCWKYPEGALPLPWAWIEDGAVWDDFARASTSRDLYDLPQPQFVRAMEALATAAMPSPTARAHQLRFIASLIATPDQVLRWAIRSPEIFEQVLGSPDLGGQPWPVIRPFLAFRDHEYMDSVTPDTLTRYLRPQGQAAADPARLATVMAESWVRLDVCESLARDGAAAGWSAPLAAAMRLGLAHRRHALQCRWSPALAMVCGPTIIGPMLASVTTDILRVRPESSQGIEILQIWRSLPPAWWAALPLEDHVRLLQVPHAELRELAIAGFRAEPPVAPALAPPTDVPSAPPPPTLRR